MPDRNQVLLVGGSSAGGEPQPLALLFSGSAATVTTDKTDYQPRETVIITGSGWQPGETVDLNVHRDNGNPLDSEYTAVADANGDIRNEEMVVRKTDLGVTFLLTATGRTSGYTAQTTFTDGNLAALTLSPPSGLGRPGRQRRLHRQRRHGREQQPVHHHVECRRLPGAAGRSGRHVQFAQSHDDHERRLFPNVDDQHHALDATWHLPVRSSSYGESGLQQGTTRRSQTALSS